MHSVAVAPSYASPLAESLGLSGREWIPLEGQHGHQRFVSSLYRDVLSLSAQAGVTFFALQASRLRNATFDRILPDAIINRTAGTLLPLSFRPLRSVF